MTSTYIKSRHVDKNHISKFIIGTLELVFSVGNTKYSISPLFVIYMSFMMMYKHFVYESHK